MTERENQRQSDKYTYRDNIGYVERRRGTERETELKEGLGL